MGFFDESGGERLDSLESLAQVESGGIPLAAQSRLHELLGAGAPFTSTLGIGEFALLTELGCVPLGQVLGASVHHVGRQYLPAAAQWGGGEVFCSLDQVATAWSDARERAFARLGQEASALGADAVVGVRLRRGEQDWAKGVVDYVVTGTAIRAAHEGPGAADPRRGLGERPAGRRQVVLSDLSGQEYWTLARAGWAPAALVAATSVMFVSQSLPTQWRRRRQVTRTQEYDEFTRGFAAGRASAAGQLRRQARAAGASGIIGVSFEHRVAAGRVRVGVTGAISSGLSPTTIAMGAEPLRGKDRREGIMVTIQATGTAVTRRSAGGPLRPAAVLSLVAGARTGGGR